MKIIYIFFGLVIGITSQNLKAQSQLEGLNFGDLPKPVPSVSSLSTYVNTPTSLTTGIPNISLPIAKIPAVGNAMDLGVSLRYHAGNVNQYEPAGEAGAGWSLMSGGVISREIVGDVDEKYDDSSAGNYVKNAFDDLYYYSFPGGFGKFKINRDIQNNTFSIENLSPNKIRFDYTRDSNMATLRLTSFTLTDEKGYKYLFSDYWVATMYQSYSTRKEYKSAFFLSKILSPDNVEIAGFSYQKDDRFIPGSSQLSYRSCKLKTIQSPGLGSISIDYNYESQTGALNDPYSVASVSLKDHSGAILEKYLFEYDLYGYYYPSEQQNKRVLLKLKRTDRNLVVTETTGFVYDVSGSTTSYNPAPGSPYGEYLCQGENNDPKHRTQGILKWINLPTGGRIEYNYEANQVFKDKNSPGYLQSITETDFIDPEIQYIKPQSEFFFDTNQGTSYLLSVTTSNPNAGKRLYVDFQVANFYSSPGNGFDPYDPSVGQVVDYVIKKDGQVYSGGGCNAAAPNLKIYTLPPGVYTIQISGTGGNGTFNFYEIGKVPTPYKNATAIGVEGVRIKNIKNYENFFTGQPLKTIEYEYDEFADPLTSSGYVFSNEDNGNSNGIYLPYVLYKNVKVKESDNGYVKHYFKLPSDYPYLDFSTNTVDPNYLPFYNITKKGILDKVETYNSQGHLLSSKTMEYQFEGIPGADEYVIYSGIKSWPAWLKKHIITEKVYDPATQVFVESKVENTYSSTNYEITSTKKTSSEGGVLEKLVKYAVEKGNTALINANMLSVPLEVESRSNGKLIDKAETRYELSGRLLPSSHVSVNANDGSQKTRARYDSYDSKGNLVQYTVNIDENGNGYPVTYVWGYNQTLPIAKVEGAQVSDIGTLAADAITKSDTDVDAASEKTLLSALDSFRTNPALKSFKITTYTYDPLTGVSSVTPPSGIREAYTYDAGRRLRSQLDVDGNITNDYKYNTKTP